MGGLSMGGPVGGLFGTCPLVGGNLGKCGHSAKV